MKPSIVNDLRTKLQERLQYHTYTDAAKESGVSRTALHRFASGERSLRPETLDRLCNWLGYKSINWR